MNLSLDIMVSFGFELLDKVLYRIFWFFGYVPDVGYGTLIASPLVLYWLSKSELEKNLAKFMSISEQKLLPKNGNHLRCRFDSNFGFAKFATSPKPSQLICIEK